MYESGCREGGKEDVLGDEEAEVPPIATIANRTAVTCWRGTNQ